MKPTIWTDCYDSSWKGLITDASFAHPAKFARGLIERIYDHCLAQGYLKRGDLVADVFGGIGTGGITAAYRGLNWVGCELEPKFVTFANENFEMHRRFFDVMGFPMPRIIQGDSRNFDENVAAVVSSPPYAETQTTVGNVGNAIYKEYGKASSLGKHDKYGEQEGQIGSLKSGAVEAVISSPPYNLPMSQDHNGSKGGIRGTTQIEPGAFAKYGNEAGQIEGLSQGQVDSVIASPPFAGTSGKGGGGINVNGYKPAPGRKWTGDKSDPVGSRTYQGQGGDRTDGNIETLKEGTVKAVVGSPPYSDISAGAGGLNTKPAKKPGQQSGRKAESASQDTDQRYGTSTGQISQLKGGSVDGVVSSPPFESSLMTTDTKFMAKVEKDKRNGSRLQPGLGEYGQTEGQIGKESGETYWQAVDGVYRSCFRAIRSGGIIALVVKDYCAKSKRVRLCDDTLRLLEHIGFVPLERIHAMLVTETVEAGLWGDHRKKKQRKSFFRRIYEEKLPEGDDRRIDHEEVLICRRP